MEIDDNKETRWGPRAVLKRERERDYLIMSGEKEERRGEREGPMR